MRDYSNRRSGFDRVLMAVAATFLTVSAGTAFAQSPSPRDSTSELAIDAAVPKPEPVDVAPLTASDFKADTTASVPDAAKVSDTTVGATSPDTLKPADTAVAPTPAASPAPVTATAPAATPAAELSKEQAREQAKEVTTPATTIAASEQPVADRLRELFGARSSKLFDRKGERAAVEKFYTARDYAPLWTQNGTPTATARSVMARLKDAGSDGLNAADYPAPDFTLATTPDALAEADLKLTASMLDYARQAQSGRMHWSQISGDIAFPEHPIDPAEVLANVSTAKDASAALASYNPPHKAYRELKKKLAELRGETGLPDRKSVV